MITHIDVPPVAADFVTTAGGLIEWGAGGGRPIRELLESLEHPLAADV